jgi:catechol 2,3-dioxygenase-like lactoylglutathione lyase family enzyme
MISRVRITRPTRELEATLKFYVEGLGGTKTDHFRDHAGYSGDIVQLPDCDVEIELVHGPAMAHSPAPTPEDALVLQAASVSDLSVTARRLARLGHQPVRTENPYWHGRGATWRDPDGYLLILCANGSSEGAGA